MKRVTYCIVVTMLVTLGAGFASAMDLHVFVAGDTIRASEVNENFAELAAALEGAKTLSFTARSFSHNPASAIIEDDYAGLLWAANFAEPATLVLTAPADWDGTSAVTLDLYFFPTTASGGAVSFFIRPRAYDVGDLWVDGASLGGPAVVAVEDVLTKQTFTIPAARFGTGELWYITVQREGAGETYNDEVRFVGAALTYQASH